jgi:hypothetical protein
VLLDSFSCFGIWFSPPRLTQKVSDLPPDLVALVNLLSLERVDDLVGWVRGLLVVNLDGDLGVLTPSPPIEGTECLPTPKRRRFANKLPYIRVDLA